MSLRQQFATNEKKTNDGFLVTFGKNEDGTIPAFHVARMSQSNKAYAKTLERVMKPHQRQIQLKTIDNDLAKRLLMDVFAASILKGWEHVKLSDVTGNSKDSVKDAPFTKDNVIALMTALPDLYEELSNQASDASNYLEGVAEESAKN